LKLGIELTLLALVERAFVPVTSFASDNPAQRLNKLPELLERIKNEKLTFQIFYLDLIKFAEGYVLFGQRSEKYFFAESLVEVAGISDLFTNYKSQLATSNMELSLEPAPRLIPRTFNRHIVLRDRQIQTRNTFDYKRCRWSSKIYRDGKLKKRRRRKIPDGVIYENFLSAFYNLRLEAFGPIAKGQTIEFNTIPYKGVDSVSLEIASPEAEKNEARWLKGIGDAEFLIMMQVTEKIMGIKPAKLLAAADKDLIPIAGLIKDALPLGNIYVDLKSRERIPASKHPYRIKNIQRSPATESLGKD